MKLFVLSKLEALAIASVPFALGVTLTLAIAWVIMKRRSLWKYRRRRRTRLDDLVASDLAEFSTK